MNFSNSRRINNIDGVFENDKKQVYIRARGKTQNK